MPNILSETRGHIRVLTISNEAKRNALEGHMAAELLAQFDACEADNAIRAVVVTGAGEIAFCSGHDLKEISSGAYAATGLGEAPVLRPLTMKKPVIAAINGHCYAAALILAMSCDFRVASRNAAFGSPGVRLGMLPEGGQIGRLPLLMSRTAALELMLTGKPLAAEEAWRAGFVSELTEPGEALAGALKLAQSIAVNAPAVVSAVKRGVLLGEADGVASAEHYEQTVARQLEVEPDAIEGVKAFFEKRAPVFTGVA
jgi:enoyl-CoA hydratase/carnithine racemase